MMHKLGMIYGHERVLMDAQDLTSQLAKLKAAGCEKVFREKTTGTTADRPQLAKAAMLPSPRPLTGFRATRPACS
jgi:hypothetical protein